MKKRSHFKGIILTLLSIIALIIMILLNDISTHLHIKELKVLIQKKNKEESNLNHINLIMNYKINKKLYENEILQSEADLKELRSNMILLTEVKNKNIELEKYQILSIPVLKMINFLRFFIGKEPMKEFQENKIDNYLALAYYYERNKKYSKALEVYQKAFNETKSDKSKLAPILLHEGFCYAILGQTPKARLNYQKIIKEFNKDDIVLTAMVLLKYLDGFELERKKVNETDQDLLDKSEKLYKLLAYQESIKVLNDIEDKVPKAQKSRVQFLKGRSLEELGSKEEALRSYQTLISEDPKSNYAKSANSRIFIMATREFGGDKLKQLAIKNNEMIKDENMNKMLNEYSSLGIESINFYDQFQDKEIAPQLKEIHESNTQINLSEITQKNATQTEKTKPIESQKKVNEIKKETLPNKEVQQFNPVNKVKPVKIKIITKKGDIFTGELVKETKETIVISTILGDLKISKSDVVSRKVIQQ